MRAYLLIALVAAIVTYLATPLARFIAIRAGAVTAPRNRDVHTSAIPRMGGLAMYTGLAGALLIATQIGFFTGVFDAGRTVWAVLTGGAIVVAVGVLDDIYDIGALTKLAGQALGALVMAFLGVQIYSLPVGGLTVTSGRLSLIITVVVVVVLMNAVNFIDGLDGLAAGVIAIGAIGFFGYTYGLARTATPGDYSNTASLVIAALVGICIGFLPHNFHSARIFMGDSGSMLLGLVFAAAAIIVTGQIDTAVVSRRMTVPVFLPVLVPLAVVAVPLLDLALAVIRRTASGKSPFSADKKHLHHRMLDLGHSHRQAVIILYVWAAVVSFGTALLIIAPTPVAVGAMVGGALIALALSMGPLARDRKRTPMPDMTEPVRAVFANAWRNLLVFVAILTVASLLVGYLVAGPRGLWGAVLGIVATLLFSGTTVASALFTARSSPTTTAVVVLGSWVVKMILLVVMLLILGDRDFYSKPVFAVVLLLGAFGSAVIDFIAVTRSRVPYVADPDARAQQ